MRYNLKLVTILIILQLLSVGANSQEIIKTLFGQYKEKYVASIDNKEVKDGPYSVFCFNKLVIQGIIQIIKNVDCGQFIIRKRIRNLSITMI